VGAQVAHDAASIALQHFQCLAHVLELFGMGTATDLQGKPRGKPRVGLPQIHPGFLRQRHQLITPPLVKSGVRRVGDVLLHHGRVHCHTLDPFPFCGGTTTLQALGMAVPVLTPEAGHFVSRMGTSFMSAAGLPEWVAQDDASFVAKATSLGQDRQALLALKVGLRARLRTCPSWDADRDAADYGWALRTMWYKAMVAPAGDAAEP